MATLSRNIDLYALQLDYELLDIYIWNITELHTVSLTGLNIVLYTSSHKSLWAWIASIVMQFLHLSSHLCNPIRPCSACGHCVSVCFFILVSLCSSVNLWLGEHRQQVLAVQSVVGGPAPARDSIFTYHSHATQNDSSSWWLYNSYNK
jgi:hypothetical protein